MREGYHQRNSVVPAALKDRIPAQLDFTYRANT